MAQVLGARATFLGTHRRSVFQPGLAPDSAAFWGVNLWLESLPSLGHLAKIKHTISETLPNKLNILTKQAWPPTRQDLWGLCDCKQRQDGQMLPGPGPSGIPTHVPKLQDFLFESWANRNAKAGAGVPPRCHFKLQPLYSPPERQQPPATHSA